MSVWPPRQSGIFPKSFPDGRALCGAADSRSLLSPEEISASSFVGSVRLVVDWRSGFPISATESRAVGRVQRFAIALPSDNTEICEKGGDLIFGTFLHRCPGMAPEFVSKSLLFVRFDEYLAGSFWHF
jgi:hypothetical protein